MKGEKWVCVAWSIQLAGFFCDHCVKSIGADTCLSLLGKILKLVMKLTKFAAKLSAKIRLNRRLRKGMRASKLFQQADP